MELQEYLDKQLPEGDEERQGFVIDDEEKANWAMRKIKHLQDKKAEKEAIAKAEIDRIKQWLEEENASINRDIEFFTNALEIYMRKLNQKNPKTKSIKLIHGKLQLRKQQPKFNYDDGKLLRWLKENRHQNFIRIKESPDKSALKKSVAIADGKAILKDTGEIVEGISVEEPDEPAFSLKVNE